MSRKFSRNSGARRDRRWPAGPTRRFRWPRAELRAPLAPAGIGGLAAAESAAPEDTSRASRRSPRKFAVANHRETPIRNIAATLPNTMRVADGRLAAGMFRILTTSGSFRAAFGARWVLPTSPSTGAQQEAGRHRAWDASGFHSGRATGTTADDGYEIRLAPGRGAAGPVRAADGYPRGRSPPVWRSV